MALKYTHPSILLVRTLKRLYDYGMTTTSGGNLSILDAEGNIWITPSGIDKGTLKPEDIIKVTPKGKAEGCHKPSCELPFHRSMYACRKDVRAVLHAHSPALVACSLVGRVPNTALIPGASEICGKTVFAKYEIPGSEKLGKIIAAQFAKGADSVIMENHGAVVCAATIEEAFARFEMLDSVARVELAAATMGKKTATPLKKAPARMPEFKPGKFTAQECALRAELAAFSARARAQEIFHSGSGVFAARLGKDDFLINRLGADYVNDNADDFVRVKGGKREAGKFPAFEAALCRMIFQKHPQINAVSVSKPTNLMGFASAGKVPDSRTIPESYIMMRDVPCVNGADFTKDCNAAVKRITPSTPVVMIANVGLITTGAKIVEAFDRLEVTEFTAKCLLLAEKLGKFTPINQKQVDEIIDVFHLPPVPKKTTRKK